jgi:glutamine amidotransferase
VVPGDEPPPLIGIADLDIGNLRSVSNAVRSCGYEPVVAAEASQLEGISHLIVPGVGSFRLAMQHMRERGLFEPIRRFASEGRPVLGICLGMQLLATAGDEGGWTEGLDLIPGEVRRFDPARVPAVPHVGWNDVRLVRTHCIFARVRSGADFYFVHSYHLVCRAEADVVAEVEYGGEWYPAVVARGSVVGLQFHPEKSQANGLRLIENFCAWDGRC